MNRITRRAFHLAGIVLTISHFWPKAPAPGSISGDFSTSGTATITVPAAAGGGGGGAGNILFGISPSEVSCLITAGSSCKNGQVLTSEGKWRDITPEDLLTDQQMILPVKEHGSGEWYFNRQPTVENIKAIEEWFRGRQ